MQAAAPNHYQAFPLPCDYRSGLREGQSVGDQFELISYLMLLLANSVEK
jgi:hypothetical protein